MSYLPKMPRSSGIRKTVQMKFGGYDRSPGSGNGTLCDTENLSTERYPAISSRQPRRFRRFERIAAMLDADGTVLRIMEDGRVYYGDRLLLRLEQRQERTLASFGRNVVVFPDKIILNLFYPLIGEYATAEVLSEAVTEPSAGAAYLVGEGDAWEKVIYAYVDGQWQENGKLLQRMEVNTPELYVTFGDGSLYDEAATDNTITCEGINWADYFEIGDAVQISGCEEVKSNNKIAIIREIDGHELRFYENCFTRKAYPAVYGLLEYQTSVERPDDTTIIYAFLHNGVYHTFTLEQAVLETDCLVMEDSSGQVLEWYRNGKRFSWIGTQECEQGVTPIYHREIFFEDSFETGASEKRVRLARTVPEMDFCFGDENRLWGVKGNTIYASKLGDPKNFYTFEGLSTDSWSVTVQTPGEFTAAFCYAGYPTFFKEDRIIKLYGSSPQNYQLSEISAMGVKRGCEKSLAVVADMLFYVSPSGVMAYSGSYTDIASAPLGKENFSNAVAGSDGVRYYCCMDDGDGTTLYLLDTRHWVWIKERKCEAITFVKLDGGLYLIERTEDENLCWELGTEKAADGLSEEETAVKSMAEFGDIEMQQPNRKSVHRLQLRMEAEDAQVRILIQYDSSGQWIPIQELTVSQKQSFYLPILPRRCDHFRLRIEGAGKYEISSLALEVRTGSEVF